MSAPLTAPTRSVAESGRPAQFTTVADDGWPHTTIVWTGLDAGAV